MTTTQQPVTRICPQCFGTKQVPTEGHPLHKLPCGYCGGSGVSRR